MTSTTEKYVVESHEQTVVTSNKSVDELYQGRHSSTGSEESTATALNDKQDKLTFNSRKEYIEFTLLIVGIVLAMFMMSLNSTVVAPAMSIIAAELDGLESQTWIATAYLVALNSFQPLSGRFSDIFGRKSVLMFGVVLFFVGSLVNALSTNINMLIAGRTVQGFGGGGVMSMTYIIITDIAPVHLLPRFQSMLAVVYGLASVVGPLLGGAFVDHATWHWDFWLNVIIAALVFVIMFFYLKDPKDENQTSFASKLKRVDWFGTLFSTTFIVCLLLALNWGSSYGWSSAHSIGPFVASGVSFIGLVVVEGWVAADPLLPGRVLLNPKCMIVYGYMMCLGLTFIGTLYFGPVYYQSVFGADSTQSGIRLIPFMVGLIGGSVGCGILVRRFPHVKYFICIGAACNLLGYGLFYTVNVNSSWGQQAGYLTFCGFAFGLSQQNSILTVQAVVEKKDMAVATSCINFFMMLASSVGIAIYQTLYQTFLKGEMAKIPMDILMKAQSYGSLANFLFIRQMPAEVQKPIIEAYSTALHKVFLLPIAAAALGFILTLFFPNIRYGAKGLEKQDEEISIDEKNVSL